MASGSTGSGPRGAADPGSGPAAGDPIAPIVEEFLFASDADGGVDLGAFVARFPEPQRDEIRARCAAALAVRARLRRPPAAPSRFGDFIVERELGRGGMGVVHLARHATLGRRVAIKVLALPAHLAPRAVERFRREAMAAARLDHPGIVAVHSVGETDGKLWFVMDYVEGRDLAEILDEQRAAHRAGGPLPAGAGRLAAVARVVAEVADALACAHGHGIVHRDIKPANFMIDGEGRAHVLDFGLSKSADDPSMSLSGDLTGTPFYMSPEQAARTTGPVDGRSDVFSLGVVLYELLTLRRPFEGDELPRLLADIATRTPPSPREVDPGVPRDLDTICRKAMEKEPAHRFASAAELAADLRRFLNYESIRARPPTAAERGVRLLRRHPVASTAAAAAVVLVAVLLAAQGWWNRRQRLEAELAPVRRLAATPDIEGAPLDLETVELVLGAQARIDSIRRDLGALPPDVAALLDEQAGRIERFAQARLDGAVQRIDRAFDRTRAHTPASQFLDVAGSLTELLAAALASGPAELSAVRDVFTVLYPTLTLRTDADPAQAWLVPLDESDGRRGEPVRLGETPLVEQPVAPGYYRIVLVAPGRGHAELTRLLDIRDRCVVDARIRPTADVVAGRAGGTRPMVRVPSEPFVTGHSHDGVGPYRVRTMQLAAFWIDPCEVTNGEYRRFLEATGRSPPIFWPAAWDAAWDELPASGMPYVDAQAYAEWAGKRLPTLAEWERAARGTDGRKTPRPEIEDATTYAAVGRSRPVEHLSDPAQFRPHQWRVYLDAIEPACEPDETRGPVGLARSLGNVSEWTETMCAHVVGEEVDLDHQLRVLKGSRWWMPAGFDLLANEWVPADFEDTSIGLRCVKSVDPLPPAGTDRDVPGEHGVAAAGAADARAAASASGEATTR